MVERLMPSWVNPITMIGTTMRDEYSPKPAAPSTLDNMMPISRLLMVTERLLPKTERMSLKYDLRAKGVENKISNLATKLTL